MKRRRALVVILGWLAAWESTRAAWADDPPATRPTATSTEALSLADLAPYRAALEGKPEGTAVPVTFRALWDAPERFEGRRVRVEGRVARRFHQPAFGTFPPLVETWAVTPAGDPLCLVSPDPGPTSRVPDPAGPGANVRFEGIFLRRVRYQGGDRARLAPLIVGHEPPAVTLPAPVPTSNDDATWGGFGPWEWGLGLAAVLVVGLVLARQHLSAPIRRPLRRERDEAPPEFLE